MAVVFAVGGVLLSAFSNQPPAWHWAMLGLTVPLVLVLGLTVPMKEPVRTGRAVENPSTLEVWREVLKYQSLILPIMAGVVVGQIALGADYIWAAPMLSRSFTLSPERLGAIMALGFLISGVLGSIAGGVLADLCHRVGGPRKTLTVLIILSSMSVPIGLFALLRDPIFSISLLVASITVATAISVMGTTLFVVVIPNELRGLCTSVMMAICVIIGSGLAPLLVSGLATEMGGDAYIGRALSFVCVATSLLGAGFFAWGRRSFARSKANNSLRDGSQVMTESGN
jgi:MFS family permease